jgi:hypothetical protein
VDAELHKTWVQKNENAKRTSPGNKSKNHFLLIVRVIKIIDALRDERGRRYDIETQGKLLKNLSIKIH